VIRCITLGKALELHARVIAQSGGMSGVLSIGAPEPALAQPRMTFGGEELYPTPVEKAAALDFSLIQNHPFVDGNKRTGHALMEVSPLLNGYEIHATVDEQEDVVLRVASGSMPRGDSTSWLRPHVRPCR